MIISFRDYALIVLNRLFPDIRSRRELLEFMNDNSVANLLWTDYMDWHCSIGQANHVETIGTWIKTLDRKYCTYKEWCFVCDVRNDDQFPCGASGKRGMDRIVEYLKKREAHAETFDAMESLWIKYHYLDTDN